MFLEGQQAFQEAVADDFIDGVMTADIFTKNDHFAFRRKNGRGVQAAGAREGFLGAAEFIWQLEQDVGPDSNSCLQRFEMLVNTLDAGFTAEAATGGDEDVAFKSLQVGGSSQENVNYISFVSRVACDFKEVFCRSDDAFGH